MKFICKNCKNYFITVPLKYKQSLYCGSCYHNKFIAQKPSLKPVQRFDFKKNRYQALKYINQKKFKQIKKVNNQDNSI